jgi:lipopolysaccharide/colanic/teichoic acid biosynthesis glycosyltransferase
MVLAAQLYLKRLLDLMGSLLVLLFASPLFIFTAAWIRMSMGSPVLFRQQRPGLNERPFEILKFRTMTNERDSDGILLPDEARLTPVGALIRKYSLDELPQFLNVLKGEMSLVGPRPLLMKYLSRYNARQAKRHYVKPGITGLTQISGRNALDWEEKFRLDTWYVENWSLLLDIRILLNTVTTVFRGRGIHNENHVTMPEFNPHE